MSRGVKLITRVDPGHKGKEIRVNFDHVAVYSEFQPDPKKDPLKGITTFVMSCGMVFAGEIDIKSVDQIFQVNKR